VYDLEQLGFSPFFEHQIRDDERALTPARVSEEQRGSFRLLGAAGSWYAELAGRLRHEAAGGAAVLPGACSSDSRVSRARRRASNPSSR
jgi:hypothetical protein